MRRSTVRKKICRREGMIFSLEWVVKNQCSGASGAEITWGPGAGAENKFKLWRLSPSSKSGRRDGRNPGNVLVFNYNSVLVSHME